MSEVANFEEIHFDLRFECSRKSCCCCDGAWPERDWNSVSEEMIDWKAMLDILVSV